MKAILCTKPGAPDDLQFTDIPDPVAAPGEAVVRVAAAALNFFDTLIIADKYQVKPVHPFSPAAEFAGTIERVGDGVTGFTPGQRVMGYMRYGAARELIAVSAAKLVAIPDALDFEHAAGLSVIYGTTCHALQDRGRLQAGETLAVLGAAGGTGLSAVEVGKLMGARVIACASSDEKCDFARKHGADETINYATQDLKAELKRLGGARGIDVVYDPIGGAYSEAALRALGWEGRLLVIGFATGEIPKIPLNLALLKSCDIVGVAWGSFTERFPEQNAKNMQQIVRWAAEGKLSMHVHATYPLAETPQALKEIAARKVMGKAIIRP
jgi:NADPH2:quinone reductase